MFDNLEMTDSIIVTSGATWNVHRYFVVRGGVTVVNGEGGALGRFGFTVPWREWGFDYAAAFNPGGLDHLIALNYSFGGEKRETLLDNWQRVSKARRAEREGGRSAFRFDAKEGNTLAVSDFEAQGVSGGDAAVVADLFRNEIVRGGVFSVVEKANMTKILEEQAFQQTGCTTQECAVKIGKILNVKYLVVGGFGKLLDQYVINVRVVDVESAGVVYSDVRQISDPGKVSEGVHDLAASLTEAVRKAK